MVFQELPPGAFWFWEREESGWVLPFPLSEVLGIALSLAGSGMVRASLFLVH